MGNPPWIKADPQKEEFAYAWITENQKERPISNYSVSEAFSWRVIDILFSDGYAGLILPAKSLYNHNSQKYRQQFFLKNEVSRMTNFSNMRRELFDGRAIAPAVTIIYRNSSQEGEKPLIDHYGPFLIHQTSNIDGRLLTITMNNSEYQAVSPYEAESGEATTWKYALWGTYRDRRAIARLRKLFPMTLGQLYKDNEKNGWHLHEGSQLRDNSRQNQENIDHIPYLIGKIRLNTTIMDKSERQFSIPENALQKIPPEECNIRVQGGSKGLLTSNPPHIILNASWKYVIYSNEFFVVPPRQIGLSAPEAYEDYLQALSLYLSSSLVRYYLFFQTPSFGIERDRITLRDVKSIPVPEFTSEQIQALVGLHKDLVQREASGDAAHLQNDMDEQIARLLKVPSSINTLANEFNRIRLNLIENARDSEAIKYPNSEDLIIYARQLQSELDGFATTSSRHHQITIDQSPEVIACTVELKSSDDRLPIVVKDRISGDAEIFVRLRNELNKDFSQWVYVEKELRVFEGSSVHIYKKPLLINWTNTQALNDADDIIAESLYPARNNLNELLRP